MNLTTIPLEIIMGEFPAHGEAFYDYEIKRTDILPGDFRERMGAKKDRAAAHLKTGRFEGAIGILEEIEEEDPGRYDTVSNLGVTYKKMGRYEEAAEAIEKALEIRPGGHMDLGDYYLRMLRWRAGRAEGNAETDGVNFLGIPYDLPAEDLVKHPAVDKKHLLSLVKNDRHFHDTYAVLGDVFQTEKSFDMARRSYLQAIRHLPETGAEDLRDVYESRLADLKQDWPLFPESNEAVEREFEAAEQWVTEFQKMEAVLVADKDKRPEQAEVLKAMKSEGIKEPRFKVIYDPKPANTHTTHQVEEFETDFHLARASRRFSGNLAPLVIFALIVGLCVVVGRRMAANS